MTHAVDVRRRERAAEEREDVTLELLEALARLLFVAEVTTFSDHYPLECEQARAAIAKAEALNRGASGEAAQGSQAQGTGHQPPGLDWRST